MNHYDIVIIGAGISGLCFAHFAASNGLKVLVLEKESRVGGLLESVGSEHDFWLELGGHTCYNSYTTFLEVLETYGALELIIPRAKLPYYLWDKQRAKPIFWQLNLLELSLRAWRLKSLDKQGHSLKSYYSKVMGPRNYAHVLSHAFSSVLSQPADDYPATMLFNKRPQRREDILRKYTFSGGLQAAIERIHRASSFDIKMASGVQSIDYEQQYQLKTEQQTFYCNHLVMATPVQITTQLLQSIEPELSEQLSHISTAALETIGIIYNNGNLKANAGLISTDDIFYSSVSRDILPHHSLRGMSFHFPAGHLSFEEKLKHIINVLGISEKDIVNYYVKQQILPAPKVGHEAIIDRVDHMCESKSLTLIGNYFHGLSIEDCAVRAKQAWDNMQAT